MDLDRLKGEPGPELSALLNKINVPCDLKAPSKPPSWLDKDLFQVGTRFFKDYYFPVVFSSIQSLLIGISIPNLCYPLVMTQKSENVEKAFVRYSLTGLYITKLYEELPWDKKSAIQTINGYHKNASNLVYKMPWSKLKSKADEIIQGQDKDVKTLEPLDYVLLEALNSVKTSSQINWSAYDKYIKAEILFSQFDMAMVQCAFFAGLIVFPKMYGIENVPRKCVEGLAHVWRVTAYYMGVDDDANLVKDDFDETYRLLMDIGYFIIAPALLSLNYLPIVMGKNVAKSIGLDYHVNLYITAKGYGVDLRQLWNEFSWLQKAKFYWFQWMMGYLYYCKYFRLIWNKMARFASDLNISRAKSKTL